MPPSTRFTDILVVDDDPDELHGLAQVLVRHGYAVATAVDGWRALEYIRRHGPPSLILLDLAMPEMDGWEFLHIRRHDAELAAVPVVAFSALGECGGDEPRRLGALTVLEKPINLQRLLDTARRHCSPHPQATRARDDG